MASNNYNKHNKYKSNNGSSNSNKAANKTDKIKATIPGQGTPIDTATGILWSIPEYFAEVFNKVVFKKPFIMPEDLDSTDEVEATFLKVRDIYNLTLKKTRDVAKVYKKDGSWLLLLGIENQNKIDFQMPFRIYQVEFISYARQVAEIERKNKSMKKEDREGEYISGFKATDKLRPVITLVIYYGDDEWKTPRSLRDMLEECEGKYIASDYKMHLLDVKHMAEDELNNFSPDLRAFLGFLRYMGKPEFTAFMDKNSQNFDNLPPLTTDALIEITHSPELKKIKENFRTETGGINMRNGIKMYGLQQRQAGMAEGRAEGITVGINQANERVARDMLSEKDQPFTISMIAKISKLSEDFVRNLANSI